MKKNKYKRYRAYAFRADRNVFSWQKLEKMAKSRGNSINEEINYALNHWLLKHEEEGRPDSWVKS